MKVFGERYKASALSKHSIFKEVNKYIDFYFALQFSVMSSVTMGTSAVLNIDTYVLASMQGTLESIVHVAKNGRFGDAYALLRKYHDSVITNIYVNTYLEEKFSLENFTVAEIDKWVKGTSKVPDYRKMMQYVKQSERIRPVVALLYSDDRYKKLKQRCDDHLHYNYFKNFVANDNGVQYCTEKYLDLLMVDISDVFVLHIGCLFYLREDYMRSSDYLDALEVGLPPEDQSQYWVAPLVQDIFTNILVKKRPDIASVIHKSTSMHLSV